MSRPLLLLAVATLLPACTDNTVAPAASPVRRLVIAAGDEQDGAAGRPVAVAPVVLVSDSAGVPLAGVEVIWRVLEGGGRVEEPRTLTDSAGRGTAQWILGSDTDAQLLHATTEGAAGVTFRAWSNIYFTDVAAGWRHSCSLDHRGVAWCWGSNDWGQLGDGTRAGSPASRRVAGDRTFATIATGALHSCALTAAGTLFCWGDNGLGQLGDGTTQHRMTPVRVAGSLTFRALTLGYTHTCAITAADALYCWGTDHDGQVGAPGQTLCGPAPGVPCHRQPAAVALPAAVADAAAGETHTCAVLVDGRTFCWGANDWGQLGTGDFGGGADAPAAVTGEHVFARVTAASRSTCALDTDGDAYCWGMAVSGRLGNGDVFNRAWPEPVDSAGLGFTDIRMGEEHTCARTGAGAVWCWGAVLGHDSIAQSLVPVRVTSDVAFTTLSSGGSHLCAYGEGIWCWGSNASGQLGIGRDSVAVARTPLRVRRGLPAGLAR